MTIEIANWIIFGLVGCVLCLVLWAWSLKDTIKENAEALNKAVSEFEVAKAKGRRDDRTIADMVEAERLATLAKEISAPHVKKRRLLK